MQPDIIQLEDHHYGGLLKQIRYWEARGYELITGTYQYHHLYVVLMQKRPDVRPARLIVSIGKPKFK